MNSKWSRCTILCLALFLMNAESVFSQSARPTTAPAATQKLWRQWYVYSLNGLPKGIYREEFHLDPNDGQAVVYQKITERDGKQLKATTVVSTGMNDLNYSPVKFYAKQNYLVDQGLMSRYFIFEGVHDGSNVGIRVHDSQIDGDPSALILTAKEKYVFGAFLPMFLNKLRETSRIDTKKETQFKVLLEEGENSKFRFTDIIVRTGNKIVNYDVDHCHLYVVQFDSVPSNWYVSEKGKLCRMQIPTHGVNLQMVSEKKAKSYL